MIAVPEPLVPLERFRNTIRSPHPATIKRIVLDAGKFLEIDGMTHPKYSALNKLSAFAWTTGSLMTHKGTTLSQLQFSASKEERAVLEPLLKELKIDYKVENRYSRHDKTTPSSWSIYVSRGATITKVLGVMGVPKSSKQKHSEIPFFPHVQKLFEDSLKGNELARGHLLDFFSVLFLTKARIGCGRIPKLVICLPDISSAREGQELTKEYAAGEAEKIAFLLNRALGINFNTVASVKKGYGYQIDLRLSPQETVKLVYAHPELFSSKLHGDLEKIFIHEKKKGRLREYPIAIKND